MKTFRLLLLAAALITVEPGCSAIFSNLPKITAYVQDAELIVGAIESFAQGAFAVGLLPGQQKVITTAIARTKAALSGIAHAAAGGEKLNQADVDAAFAEFRSAYTQLVGLVQGIPGFSVASGQLMAAAAEKDAPAGRLRVPPPLLMKGAP